MWRSSRCMINRLSGDFRCAAWWRRRRLRRRWLDVKINWSFERLPSFRKGQFLVLLFLAFSLELLALVLQLLAFLLDCTYSKVIYNLLKYCLEDLLLLLIMWVHTCCRSRSFSACSCRSWSSISFCSCFAHLSHWSGPASSVIRFGHALHAPQTVWRNCEKPWSLKLLLVGILTCTCARQIDNEQIVGSCWRITILVQIYRVVFIDRCHNVNFLAVYLAQLRR